MAEANVFILILRPKIPELETLVAHKFTMIYVKIHDLITIIIRKVMFFNTRVDVIKKKSLKI